MIAGSERFLGIDPSAMQCCDDVAFIVLCLFAKTRQLDIELIGEVAALGADLKEPRFQVGTFGVIGRLFVTLSPSRQVLTSSWMASAIFELFVIFFSFDCDFRGLDARTRLTR